MNKMFDGRPQWSNWGGLNDVLRGQELSMGLAPSSYNFGGLLGSTNINLRASSYRAGGRITYSSSNRSYNQSTYGNLRLWPIGRRMVLCVFFRKTLGRRRLSGRYIYDANSFFASIEKKINDNHSLNLVGFYTPNRRGKSSPNTQEVFDLRESLTMNIGDGTMVKNEIQEFVEFQNLLSCSITIGIFRSLNAQHQCSLSIWRTRQ